MNYKNLYPVSVHEKLDQYIPYFSKYENKYNLPEGSLAALAYIESSFDPDADGDLDLADTALGASAGMYQIRAGTGSDLGIVNLKEGIDNRKNVDISSDAAARLLKSHIEFFDGDINKGIQAYNGGRGNVGSNETLDYLDRWNNYIPSDTDINLSKFDLIKDTVDTGLDTLEDKVSNVSDIISSKSSVLTQNAKDVYNDTLDTLITFVTGNAAVAKDIKSTILKPEDIKEKEEEKGDFSFLKNIVEEKEKGDFSFLDKVKPIIDIENTEETSKLLEGKKVPGTPINLSFLLEREQFSKIVKYLGQRLEDKEELKNLLQQPPSAVVNYWLNHNRKIDYAFTFGTTQELDYIANASTDQAITAAESYALYERTPDFYELGLQRGSKAFARTLFYGIVDPLIAASVGTSMLIFKKAAKEGIKTIIRKKILEEKTKKGLKPFEKIVLPKTKLKQFRKEAETKKLKQKVLLGTGQVGVDAAIGALVDTKQQQLEYYRDTALVKAELIKQLNDNFISIDEYNQKIKSIAPFEQDKTRTGIFAGIYGLFGVGQAYSVLRKSNMPSAQFGADELALRQKRAAAETIVEKDLAEIDFTRIEKEFERLQLEDTKVVLRENFEKVNYGLVRGVEIFLGKKEKLEIPEELLNIFNSRIEEKDFPKALAKVKTETQKLLGKKITDEKLKPDAQLIYSGALATNILAKMNAVAVDLLLRNPELRLLRNDVLQKRVKINEAISQVFLKSQADELSPQYFEEAIKKVGLSKDEAALASTYTAQLSGRSLQAFKHTHDLLIKSVNLNPMMKEVFNLRYGELEKYKDKSSSILKGFNRLERESKALLVSAIDTTIRNGIGTNAQLTFKTGQLLLDAAITSAYTNLESQISGTKISISKRPSGPAIVEDSILALANAGTVLRQVLDTILLPARPEVDTLKGMIADATPERLKVFTKELGINRIFRSRQEINNYFHTILKDDSYTADLLLNSLQDTGEQRLSRFAKAANTFNLGVDAFYRSIFFVNSVERQLSKKNISLDEAIKKDAPIPAEIIEQAAQDALDDTFSLDLKRLVDVRNKPYKELDVEGKAAVMTGAVVEAIDSFPTGSIWIATFPRFMANQMRKMYLAQPFQAKFFKLIDTFKASRVAERINGVDEAIEVFKKTKEKYNDDLVKLTDLKSLGKITDTKYIQRLESLKNKHKKVMNEIPNIKGMDRSLPLPLYRYSPDARDSLLEKLYAVERDNRNKLITAISGAAIGTSLLHFGYVHRRDNPDLPVAHMRTDLGIVDTTYLFPIGMFLAAGALIYDLSKIVNPSETKLDEAMKKNSEISRAIEIVVGVKIPEQSSLISSVRYIQENGFNAITLGQIGSTVGDVLNRIQQPFQPIGTLVDAFDMEATIRRDPKATDAVEGPQLFFERAVNQVNNRMGTKINSILADIVTTKSHSEVAKILGGFGLDLGAYKEGVSLYDAFSKIIPGNFKRKVDIPKYISAWREGDTYEVGNLTKISAGFRVDKRLTQIEREFDRLNYPWWKKFKEPQDKTYERDLIKAALPYILPTPGKVNILAEKINSPAYKRATESRKRVILTRMFQEIRKRAKLDVEIAYMSDVGSPDISADEKRKILTKRGRLYRLQYKRLSKDERREIDNIFEKKFKGTFEPYSDEEYFAKVQIYEDLREHIKTEF